MNLLEVSQITKNFGGLTAVDKVSFSVRSAELVSLMGPNGAGKTTLLNVISGRYKPDNGQIHFNDRQITNLASKDKARLGISRTFQLTRIIKTLTVLENVMAGAVAGMNKTSLLSAFLGSKAARREEEEAKERAYEILKLLNMEHRCNDLAGAMSYGQQKLIEVARVLISSPKLVLLDEPAAGLNTRETESFGEMLKHIQEKMNLSIILVEHEMGLVMRVSDRVVVMNYGKKLAEGRPKEVISNQEVVEAYLGKGRNYAAG